MDGITAKPGHLFQAADTSFELDRLPAYRDIEHGRAHWSDRMGASAGTSPVTNVI
jgi:hypothetical protein